MGWSKDYSPAQTLIYYWHVNNNLANIMSPRRGLFTVPYTGLYIFSFYGTISPNSPTKKNVYATIMVDREDAAYAFSAYDDHYETGSIQVLRRVPKGITVYVRNDKDYTVRWDGFGFCAVFINE